MPFRRWLPQVLLALAVAAVLIPFPLVACAQEQCAPITYFAPVAERFPVFRILRGDKIGKASALYNEATESGDTNWSSAYLVIRQGGLAFLMVGTENTVCRFTAIPPDDVGDMLRLIDGFSV